MDWGIWFGKLWKGLIAAMAAAGVAYLIAQVQGLQTTTGVSPWVLVIAPVALHGLGLLGNLVKHIGD